MLGGSICYATSAEMYPELAVPYSLIFLFFEFVFFTLFDKLKNRRIWGGLIYIGILAAIVFVSLRLVSAGMYQAMDWSSARKWFFALDTIDDGQFMFFNALFIGGGFIIISILYYFTQVHYRTLGVMLAILFPFVIYARRSSTMDELLVTVIISLYLAVVVHNRFLDPSQNEKSGLVLKIDRSYIISIAVFVSVSGAVTMLIDKPTYTSELERNTGLFNYDRTLGGDSSDQLEGLSKQSDQRYGSRSYSGDPLFYFTTDGKAEEYYLRRQTFMDFNGNVWTIDDRWQNGDENLIYSPENPEYSTDDILSDMKQIISYTGKKSKNPELYLSRSHGRVFDSTFSPVYLPAPLGTIMDENVKNAVGLKYYDTSIDRNAANSDSKGLDDSFDYYEQSAELYKYAKDLGISDFSDMLLQASRKIRGKMIEAVWDSNKYAALEDQYYAAARLLDDYSTARKEYLGSSNISSRLKLLAVDITKDCNSDIEKAAALQDYFSANGYKYDEEYIPDDKSIDYFVFEGKTGVCTSFATAMTLMARSVGLPARYVEGFAAFEKNDGNTFVIRDRHAHAFVEVYIPGAGWLTFDPTVADYKTLTAEEEGFEFSSLFKKLSSLAVVLAVMVFIVISLLRDRIIELFFRISQLFFDPKKRTLRLYANLIRVLSTAQKEDMSHCTVNLVREHLTALQKPVPEKLLCLFESTAFGGYAPTKQEYSDAYSEYRRCYRQLRKRQK